MDDFRDRSPHTSPQKSNIPQTFDEIVISESGATPSVDSLEKIDLEFDIEDLPSFSDQSVSDIQPPLSPNFFFLKYQIHLLRIDQRKVNRVNLNIKHTIKICILTTAPKLIRGKILLIDSPKLFPFLYSLHIYVILILNFNH